MAQSFNSFLGKVASDPQYESISCFCKIDVINFENLREDSFFVRVLVVVLGGGGGVGFERWWKYIG